MHKRFTFSLAVVSMAALSLASTALAGSLALVVTNTSYPDLMVGSGPAQDHAFLVNAYRAQGFDVIEGRDLNAPSMRRAIDQFYSRAAGQDRLVVHFTGRAASLGNAGWLLPVNISAQSPVTVDYNAPSADMLMQLLAAEPGHSAFFFADTGGAADAPFVDGLENIAVPQGVLLVTGPEKLLNDFVAGYLLDSGFTVAQALQNADPTLSVSGFVSSDVALASDAPIASAPIQTQPAPANWINLVAEQTLWAVAEKSGKISDYQEYLRRFPSGIFADAAAARLKVLTTPPAPTPADIESALRLSRTAKRDIQSNLTVLGYDTHGIDGLFGRGSRNAVAAWQGDQLQQRTGYVTADQITALKAQADARRVALEREDNRYWNATGLSGSKDDLQRYLDRYPAGLHATDAQSGLDQIQADERDRADTEEWTAAVGENTADSYRAYLDAFPEGIYARVAKRRLEALDPGALLPAQKAQAIATENRLGLNGATRLLIENRLASLGFDTGLVDGNFDDQTRSAIEAFQTSKGMTATGYMDPATVRGLLLG